MLQTVGKLAKARVASQTAGGTSCPLNTIHNP
jgi:hypothetical protein